MKDLEYGNGMERLCPQRMKGPLTRGQSLRCHNNKHGIATVKTMVTQK